MAVQRRRNNIGTSRRRRPVDDGEEEGSVAGQLDDDSLSEGSIGSAPEDDDADVEGSDESDDDRSDSSRADRTARGGLANANDRQELDMPAKPLSSCSPKQPIALAVSDTETVLNGVGDAASIHLDDLGLRRQPQPQSQSQSQPQLQPRMVAKPSTGRTPSAPPTESRRETFAEKKRQEHQKHTKERDENPAFVPTKGAFLRQHEKRSTESAPNGYRPFSKPSSRPFGLIVDGNVRRYVFLAICVPSASLTHFYLPVLPKWMPPRVSGRMTFTAPLPAMIHHHHQLQGRQPWSIRALPCRLAGFRDQSCRRLPGRRHPIGPSRPRS